MGNLLDVEDYRLIVVATATGWRAYLCLDDGVELVEDVDLGDTATPL